MLIRVYCADQHRRELLMPNHANKTAYCPICKQTVTEEGFFRSLPPMYQELVKTDFGGVLASFADIGAIDLIFRGKYPLDVEYAREKDLE